MSKLTLNMSIAKLLAEMSEGNPGALTALVELIDDNETDTDNFMKEVGSVLMLDELGIYGTAIYVLYNDICERDIVKVQAITRACQLGLISSNRVKDACSRQDYSGKEIINPKEVYNAVCDMLPNFDKKNR